MKNDLMQNVTDLIIAQLVQGTAPWVKPWSGDAGFSAGINIPTNHQTGHAYRGINTLILWMSAHVQGFTSGRWITFKQATQIGAQVRKGEKGTHIAVYKPWELRDANHPETETRIVPVLRSYTVFAIEQCDGIVLPAANSAAIVDTASARHDAAEALMAQAVIKQGGDRAFYSPAIDQITLPALAAFDSAESYYATALHELTHFSGHQSRCNRDFSRRYGDEAYAREELVAELGAAYLCAAIGIQGRLQHAEYIASWLSVLKSDKKAIFQAAGAAQKAVDFLLRAEDANENANPNETENTSEAQGAEVAACG